MPVTTRSQARYQRQTTHEGTIFSSIDSSVDVSLPSNNNPAVLTSNPSTVTLSSSGISSSSITSDPGASTQQDDCIAHSSLDFETVPLISKFQNLAISNVNTFDPRIYHNFSISKQSIMEEDCENSGYVSSKMMMTSDMDKWFNALTDHLTTQTDHIQHRFQQVVDQHDEFKTEVCQELDALRSLIQDQKPVLRNQNVSVATATPVLQPQPTTVPSVPLSVSGSMASSAPSSGVPLSSQDIQSQMLLMLTESFTKLTTALSEKGTDTQAEWPKFSGDNKKFRAWYLAIMSQLSLAPWLELYDSSTNDVVSATSNSTLNGKLYSKLILALEGTALQNAVSRKHLRANGLLLLQDLVQTYKPKNVPEVIAAKTGEFWSHTKRFPTESVDTYYNRFHELLEDLVEADEPISTKSAIRHFIFTLGPEFETIQNNFRLGNLPSAWQTQDWPSLLVLCRDYYNSIKPNMSSGRKIP